MQSSSVILLLACLTRLTTARAVWPSNESLDDATIWAAEDVPTLAGRDGTCGGIADFNPCGNPFPLDFCCPNGAQCLLLNTTSNIQATLCCPAGQDCQAISPVQCDTTLQNASLQPNSQLHSNPPTELDQCGDHCCPMGYQCHGTYCMALTAQEAAASSTNSSSSSSSTVPSSTISPSATSEGNSGVTITSLPLNEPAESADVEPSAGSDEFDGKSFAAGFVPGIALGALIAAGLVIFFLRRKRRDSGSRLYEKRRSTGHDTLTDLGPDLYRRPTVHGRSISEPTVDMNFGHRTEFLKYTPPQEMDQRNSSGLQGYIVNVHTPSDTSTNPASRSEHETSQVRNWLSHSPFLTSAQTPVPTQSPVPAHMKRGTLSFHVSPIRALKKQKSMHSLRRQMTSISNGSDSTTRRYRPRVGRSDSTETIKVLMDTPATLPRVQESTLPSSIYRPQQSHPPILAATWETTSDSGDSTASTPIEQEPNTYTPTRPGRNSNFNRVGDTLSSPYTPSNYPPRKEANVSRIPLSSLLQAPEKNTQSARDSTFSALMEKVGLRKTLLMGPDPRDWNKS